MSKNYKVRLMLEIKDENGDDYFTNDTGYAQLPYPGVHGIQAEVLALLQKLHSAGKPKADAELEEIRKTNPKSPLVQLG